MRGARWGAVVLALLLVPAGACFDTSGLSGGTKDAGNFDDSAIASDAPLDTSSDTSAPVDASEEDSATPPSSTLVQERGSSASTTTSLDVSVAGVVTAGNSLLLVVSGVQETPTSVQGGGTWNKIASSGTHVATSMWL
ncbi:MAG: hypothetical protein ACREJX_22140, partial [Polyangiaceae bacterium]